jgi:GNAT superfamily N-acetyltransferase
MRIDVVKYEAPEAAELVEEVQQEYVLRYGGRDATPVDPAEFEPPNGLFLVGYLDGVGVACGGWRSHGDDAEIKRMYVRPTARRSGVETGSKQPEAVALYRSDGYTDIAPFGHYADAPQSIHLGKDLAPS